MNDINDSDFQTLVKEVSTITQNSINALVELYRAKNGLQISHAIHDRVESVEKEEYHEREIHVETETSMLDFYASKEPSKVETKSTTSSGPVFNFNFPERKELVDESLQSLSL